MNVTISRCLIAASLLCFSVPVIAQEEEEDQSAIDELDRNKQAAAPVYEVPGAAELRDAMRRIASRPSDSYALTDAGNAALLLGDANAALNFFSRANAIQPGNGRIKTGLAIASVRTENPFEALRLFDEAVRLGVPERSIASDRALAYDLLGNFVRAQQDYALARTFTVTDKLIVQQAISLAIGGKTSDADAMLTPLLRRNVPAAWRARAYLLAARGDYKESVKVTQGFMDVRSAQQLERYLRQMPELTGAQQAAAIHLGHFPANNIGRDSDAVRAVASKYPAQGTTGAGRLVPAGTPLGGTKSAAAVKETSKERKDRLRAEKLAAKQNKDSPKIAAALPQPTAPNAAIGNGPGLTTDIARSRILEAEQASVRLVAANALPPPDNVRPLEKPIFSPAVRQPVTTSNPVTVAAATPTASAPVAVPGPITTASPPAIKPTEVLISNVTREPLPSMPPASSTPAVPPAQPKIVAASTDTPTSAVVTLNTPAAVIVPVNPPIAAPDAAASQVGVIPPQSPPVSKPVLTQPVLPAPTTVAAKTEQAPLSRAAPPNVITPIAVSPTPIPTPISTPPSVAPVSIASSAPVNQDSVPAIPNLVESNDAPISSTQDIEASKQMDAQSTPVTEVVAEQATTTVNVSADPAPAFSLDAVVSAIEIPESEQQTSVVPVNLKTLKPAAPKLSPAEQAAADKAKLSGKSSTIDSPSRFWVQIATGNVAAFSGDMRNYARKYPALFKGQDAWTSPWGNSSRLVIGPFDDMKSAKKWEADYNKAGGKGFVWRSEKGADVKPLKGR
jgi:Flp pilus assembly protein TadD